MEASLGPRRVRSPPIPRGTDAATARPWPSRPSTLGAMVSDTTTWPDEQANGSGPEPAPRRSAISGLLRALAGTIIIASFGVWVYAYSGQADRPPPDLLADTELAARAEAICLAAVTDVDGLPSATEAADGPERGEQIRRSTSRFEAMVSDLERLRVDDPEDRIIMTGWLGDWRTLLDDRLRYADAITADPDAVFLQTNVAAGERLDRRLTRVADTNRMSSCATPTDVG